MKCYVVDAFAEHVFEGNPAAVCLPDAWLPDDLMQRMAMEHNLSETAFAVREGEGYRLRWFTPGGEIDLCGHATLATAYAIMRFAEPALQSVCFETLSGTLQVERRGELYELDFPAYAMRQVDVTPTMEAAIGVKPLAAWQARDLVCVMENEEAVTQMAYDEQKLLALDGLLLHVTAKSKSPDYDCISRSYAPKLGVKEDPVCGSGHCHIVPLWADMLGKGSIVARQASSRGGTLYCRMEDERIKLAGKAQLYATMELHCN